jgi:hypothetical protein
MLTGKLAKQVQGFMDVVGFLRTEKDQGKDVRRMYVRRTQSFDAKCRFSGFKGNYWQNPSLPSILKDVGLIQAVTDRTTREQELVQNEAPNPEPVAAAE